jgi:hypothetical protein
VILADPTDLPALEPLPVPEVPAEASLPLPPPDPVTRNGAAAAVAAGVADRPTNGTANGAPNGAPVTGSDVLAPDVQSRPAVRPSPHPRPRPVVAGRGVESGAK